MPDPFAYAYGRIYELIDAEPVLFASTNSPVKNAETWWAQTQYEASEDRPRKNAIAVWSGGDLPNGHVAVVESVSSSESGFPITISESRNLKPPASPQPSVSDNKKHYEMTIQSFNDIKYQAGSVAFGVKFLGFIYMDEPLELAPPSAPVIEWNGKENGSSVLKDDIISISCTPVMGATLYTFRLYQNGTRYKGKNSFVQETGEASFHAGFLQEIGENDIGKKFTIRAVAINATGKSSEESVDSEPFEIRKSPQITFCDEDGKILHTQVLPKSREVGEIIPPDPPTRADDRVFECWTTKKDGVVSKWDETAKTDTKVYAQYKSPENYKVTFIRPNGLPQGRDTVYPNGVTGEPPTVSAPNGTFFVDWDNHSYTKYLPKGDRANNDLFIYPVFVGNQANTDFDFEIRTDGSFTYDADGKAQVSAWVRGKDNAEPSNLPQGSYFALTLLDDNKTLVAFRAFPSDLPPTSANEAENNLEISYVGNVSSMKIFLLNADNTPLASAKSLSMDQEKKIYWSDWSESPPPSGCEGTDVKTVYRPIIKQTQERTVDFLSGWERTDIKQEIKKITTLDQSKYDEANAAYAGDEYRVVPSEDKNGNRLYDIYLVTTLYVFTRIRPMPWQDDDPTGQIFEPESNEAKEELESPEPQKLYRFMAYEPTVWLQKQEKGSETRNVVVHPSASPEPTPMLPGVSDIPSPDVSSEISSPSPGEWANVDDPFAFSLLPSPKVTKIEGELKTSVKSMTVAVYANKNGVRGDLIYLEQTELDGKKYNIDLKFPMNPPYGEKWDIVLIPKDVQAGKEILYDSIKGDTNPPERTVTFAYKEKILLRKSVPEGETAVLENPSSVIQVSDGEDFLGWDKSLSNIQDDVVVRAKTDPRKYTVALNGQTPAPVARLSGTSSSKSVFSRKEYGTRITTDDKDFAPEQTGKNVTGFDVELCKNGRTSALKNVESVTIDADSAITPIYTPYIFKVTCFLGETPIGEDQFVEYGGSAIIPTYSGTPETGKVLGWVEPGKANYIISDSEKEEFALMLTWVDAPSDEIPSESSSDEPSAPPSVDPSPSPEPPSAPPSVDTSPSPEPPSAPPSVVPSADPSMTPAPTTPTPVIIYVTPSPPNTVKPSSPPVSGKLTVTFKDGKKKPRKETVTKGIKLGKVKRFTKKITRKGYKFLGWFPQESGGKKVPKTTKITKNLTLYAHWKKVEKKKK